MTCISNTTLLFIAAAIGYGSPALAAGTCSYGASIRGSYVITVQGPLLPAGTEALAGVMQADGKCGLTADLFGNYNGTPVSGLSVVGSYLVNPNMTGTLSFGPPGAPAQNFVINRLQRHRQVVGVESDNAGSAQLLIRLQQASNFSQKTLHETYSYICSSTANQATSLMSVSYDGVSSGSFSGWAYGSGGTLSSISGHATYHVNPDGTYILTTVDTAGNTRLFGGGIESLGANVPIAAISVNGSGAITGPSHCLGQLQ